MFLVLKPESFFYRTVYTGLSRNCVLSRKTFYFEPPFISYTMFVTTASDVAGVAATIAATVAATNAPCMVGVNVDTSYHVISSHRESNRKDVRTRGLWAAASQPVKLSAGNLGTCYIGAGRCDVDELRHSQCDLTSPVT